MFDKRLALAGPLLSLTIAAMAELPSAALRLETCATFAFAGARCGILTVPEDWADPSGRFIGIHVTVVAASIRNPVDDPVFLFYGGPGSAASKEALKSSHFWGSLALDRDLIFVDQRGTGFSAPLNCKFSGSFQDPQTFAIDLFDMTHLRACRDLHASNRALTQYSTAVAIRDTEAVRAALGYERINVVGESYGTRVAQEYVRRHPERIRTALLLGAVPPSVSVTEGMAKSFDATLDQLFASCESDPACAAAYPDLRSTTIAFLDTIRISGVSADIVLDHGTPRPAKVPYELALAWIRSRLYSVEEASHLPRILSRAASGDARELVRGAIYWRRALSRAISEGMYASVVCAEDIPFVDVAEEIRAATGTWLGSHRVISQQAACEDWPRAVVPADFKFPLDTEIPILVVNGDRDPATSLEWAHIAVSHLSNARLIVARNRSHNLTAERNIDCVRSLATEFIELADPAVVDSTCTRDLVLPPFEFGTDIQDDWCPLSGTGTHERLRVGTRPAPPLPFDAKPD